MELLLLVFVSVASRCLLVKRGSMDESIARALNKALSLYWPCMLEMVSSPISEDGNNNEWKRRGSSTANWVMPMDSISTTSNNKEKKR